MPSVWFLFKRSIDYLLLLQDDDSDLELEIEVVPSVIDEALCDATTCVEVLVSSYYASVTVIHIRTFSLNFMNHSSILSTLVWNSLSHTDTDMKQNNRVCLTVWRWQIQLTSDPEKYCSSDILQNKRFSFVSHQVPSIFF